MTRGKMPAMTQGTRSYRSPRREEAARATRRAVLEAARQVFLERGYQAATIDEIARVADVSRPTVFSVGTKAELLKLVRDVAIAGDDLPVAVVDRDFHAEVHEAPDAETALRLHARNVVTIGGRYAAIDEVLRQAAGSDPGLRGLWESAEKERLAGAEIVVDVVLSKGGLQPGMDRRHAVDILWLLMAPDHLNRMRGRGWTEERYESWLADTLVQQLLG